MSVREYIGARYVPVFADPIAWDNTKTYEPLTIVLYQGNSYTSKQYVPTGIDIANANYWAQTGNYNAQIEAYRDEVLTFDGRIDDNADAISDEETARANADNEIKNVLPFNDFTSTNTVKKYVDDTADSKGRKTIAIYIGNSYTDGIGSSSGTNGFFELTKHMFDEAYKFTGGGYGFGTYSGHASTFVDLLYNAIASSSFNNTEVTHVIFTSAMGDTRSICAGNESQVTSGIVNCASLINSNFPNAKGYIHYAEMVYGRQTQNSYSAKYWMAQYRVHYIFEQVSRRNGMCYIGWTGWNTNNMSGYNDTDNYHPNDSGYTCMVGAFLSAWHGNELYVQEKTASIKDPTNTSTIIKIRQINPNTAIVGCNTGTIPKNLFTNIDTEAVNSMGSIVSSQNLPAAIAVLMGTIIMQGMCRVSSGVNTTVSIYTEQNGNNLDLKVKFGYETPPTELTGNLAFYVSPIVTHFHPNETLTNWSV